MKEQDEKNEINLKDILAVIIRRKWLLVIPFILVAIFTYLASYLITPIYESSTIVSINPQMRLSSDLQRLLGVQDNYRSRASDESELRSIYNDITSTYYISQLVQKMGLDRDPALIKRVAKIASTHLDVDQTQIALDLLQEDLRDNVNVRYAAQDHVEIIVQSPTPQRAQEIANNLGDIFIQEKIKQEMSSIRTSQDFADAQLQKYETQLQQKINERTNLQQRLQQIQLDQGIGSEANRVDLKSELDRTNSDISDAETEQRQLTATLSKTPGLNVTKLTLKSTSELDGLKTDLQHQLESITSASLSYPWSDPQVMNLKLKQNSTLRSIQNLEKRLVDEQFSALDDDVRSNLARFFTVKATLEYLYSKATFVKAAVEQLDDKVKAIPEYQANLNRLDQEIQAATQIRNQFKSQQEGSNISQALFQDISSSKYRVVEPAKLALEPVKPDRKKILLMGLVLGLVVGAAAVILFELFDTSFKKVDDVETCLGLHVLAVAPRIEFISRVQK